MRRVVLPIFLLLGITVLSAHADVYPEYQDLSFQRHVKYLGMANVPGILVIADCESSPYCVEPEVGGVLFAFGAQETLYLPGKVTASQICTELTPTIGATFKNGLGIPDIASVAVAAKFRVENPVLDDPNLINNHTGQPFGGGFDVHVQLKDEEIPLEDGEQRHIWAEFTRGCTEPLASRDKLSAMGLDQTQIDAFFQQPVTVRMGVSGFTNLATLVHAFYTVRFFGDE